MSVHEYWSVVDRHKPHILLGHTKCGTFKCDKQSEGFLLPPDGEPGPGSHSCRSCADLVIRECLDKCDEEWSFYEGVEEKNSGYTIRGFPVPE